MRRFSLAGLIALGGLAACTPIGPGPIAGGPCKYDSSIVEGTVTEVDEDGALLVGGDVEFWVQASDLRKLPAVGDTLTLKHEWITEGTCTPDIYSEVSSGD